ncbi:uncharacterized protein [Dermacentor andersoni]|uniref:uncharacterized protein n=1 Tax=Dermacentor andersoni TaxID=34620 RepID=UPI002415C05F|nr:uncharacterized protein LOC129383405 [Dermacentor andersoni]
MPSSTVAASSEEPGTRNEEPGTRTEEPGTRSEEPQEIEEAPTSTAYTTKRASDAYPLLCTYGTETNGSTLFPDDGLCDLIFYDSAYKHDRNLPTLPASLSESMNAVLSASLGYRTTEIGIAFAYDHMATLLKDMKADRFLEAFWDRHAYHFGIVDMPAFGVEYKDIIQVFVVLKVRELSALAQKNPNANEPPYIVLGAVPLKHADDYASQMRAVYSPTLFISQGHFAFGDSKVPDCRVYPPTILTKPLASQGYLYDLVREQCGTFAVRRFERSSVSGIPVHALAFAVKPGYRTFAVTSREN